ncbi:Glycerol-3-phosphate regulon repressor (plasmid) [Pseudoseohaeicola sp. NH-UV-7]|uniref:DeoR/GlpR family DNA-binding transcription regulator n=1 Tax=unclassified Sulfitobacter TaxID=196795 RepID=UPI000E0A32C4|nr:DeoR/GlpR family DNA-binding transcription regulator [Sulfitobacter sp. JL08]AXI53363.1 DeoR family transcriptional regulator [Sulfitobacter sp. JL08]
MSEKVRKRHDSILGLVQERGVMSVGALAETLGVSMQTIRRDIDLLCEGDALRRRHGRIELDAQHLNTPFDQRTATNPMGKQAIGEAAAELIPDGATIFISIGSTPLSVARALRRRTKLTVITNNLSAAMALSDETSNRIILPGGELRLPDRDILGDEVGEFFGRYRAEFGIFGVAGVEEDGSLLEFHTAEVSARQRIRENSQVSVLVLDQSKFGRLAPAAGENIRDMDHIILDREPSAAFSSLIKDIGDRVILSEREIA